MPQIQNVPLSPKRWSTWSPIRYSRWKLWQSLPLRWHGWWTGQTSPSKFKLCWHIRGLDKVRLILMGLKAVPKSILLLLNCLKYILCILIFFAEVRTWIMNMQTIHKAVHAIRLGGRPMNQLWLLGEVVSTSLRYPAEDKETLQESKKCSVFQWKNALLVTPITASDFWVKLKSNFTEKN